MNHYNKNNVFAKILEGKLNCNKVYEDDLVLAFHDIYPAAPIHIIVIPKGDYVSFHDFCNKVDAQIVGKFFQIIQGIANKLGLAKDGYRIVTNHGLYGMQTVEHFHVHILSGVKLGKMVEEDHIHTSKK